jgi:hypothetical protein
VLEAALVLLEFRSPSRRIFIGSHSLPPSLVRRIGPSRGYPAPCEGELEEELRRLQRLAEGKVPVASGRQPHYRAVLPTQASGNHTTE